MESISTPVVIADLDFGSTLFLNSFTTDLGSDGMVHQEQGTVELLSSSFTQSEPPGPTGHLDYMKLVASSKRSYELYDQHTTAVTVSLAGSQFFHESLPVPNSLMGRVLDPNSDYRLASGGFLLYYPDVDLVQGVMITNDVLYAIHGVLGLRPLENLCKAQDGRSDPSRRPSRTFPFTASPYDQGNVWKKQEHPSISYRWDQVVPHHPDEHGSLHQAMFMAASPILRRSGISSSEDFHTVTIEVNPRKSVYRWKIDGETVKVHHGIGRFPADHRECVLHRGGTASKLVPRRMYLLAGTFSMLDHLDPHSQQSLVSLTQVSQYRKATKTLNGCYDALDPNRFAVIPTSTAEYRSMKLFGQGASISLKRVCISRYRDSSFEWPYLQVLPGNGIEGNHGIESTKWTRRDPDDCKVDPEYYDRSYDDHGRTYPSSREAETSQEEGFHKRSSRSPPILPDWNRYDRSRWEQYDASEEFNIPHPKIIDRSYQSSLSFDPPGFHEQRRSVEEHEESVTPNSPTQEEESYPSRSPTNLSQSSSSEHVPSRSITKERPTVKERSITKEQPTVKERSITKEQPTVKERLSRLQRPSNRTARTPITTRDNDSTEEEPRSSDTRKTRRSSISSQSFDSPRLDDDVVYSLLSSLPSIESLIAKAAPPLKNLSSFDEQQPSSSDSSDLSTPRSYRSSRSSQVTENDY